jgi:Rap1a immunity proteins
MVKHIWIVMVVLITFGTSASAEYALNVRHLYESCKAPDSSAKWAFCIAYLTGVGNMMQMVGAAEQRAPDPYYSSLALCGEISNGELVQAFKNWAEKNPGQWSSPQLVGAVTSLSETWPCH